MMSGQSVRRGEADYARVCPAMEMPDGGGL